MDVDAETVRAKVQKYFGDIPAGPPVAHREIWIAKMAGTHRKRVEDHVPQPRIYKIWNVPQRGPAEEASLRLVARCLSRGKGSRLYKRLVPDEQIATNVNAFANFREMAGQFQIVVTLKPGQDMAKAEREVDEEVQRLINEWGRIGASQNELRGGVCARA